MADEEAEVIVLSSDDESKPKVVTSPKLSLKRKKNSQKSENMENDKKLKLVQSDLFAKFPKQEPQSSSSQALLNEVYKEKEYREKFLELLEYSKSLMDETSEEEKNKIVERIVRHLNSVQTWYASSTEFKSLLDSSWKEMALDSSRVFHILFDMKKELKKHKSKLKGSLKTEPESDESSSRSKIFNGHGGSFSSGTSKESYQPLVSEINENPVAKVNIKDKISDKSHSVQRNDSDFIPKSLLSQQSKNCSEKAKMLHDFSSVGKSSILQREKSHSLLPNLGLRPSSEAPKIDNGNKMFVPLTPAFDLTLQASTSGMGPLKKAVTDKYNCSAVEPHISSTLPADPPHSKDSKAEILNSAVVKEDRNAARIKKLEKVLAELDKKIKKYQERELSLEDLDNPESSYIKEDQYKRRFTVVWKALCKLTKTPVRTGRIVEKKFHYEGSRYKAINGAIEDLINQKKPHEKFPDFSEVLNVVKQMNDLSNLGLSERDVSSEAERVFKDVGVELQIRRLRDEEELFGCYLTDNFNSGDDPAEKDETLKVRLAESCKHFEKSINEILDKYVEKQEFMGNVESKDKGSSEEDSDDNEEEEEEEEEENANEENDLPATEPNSPEPNGACKTESNQDDIIEIKNDSDKSTDPNDAMWEKPVVSDGLPENPVEDAIVIESSSESSEEDLPSLSKLIGS